MRHRGALGRAGLGALLLLTLGGCGGPSWLGRHTGEQLAVDYGEPIVLRACVWSEAGVPSNRVRELMDVVNAEFVPYGITVDVIQSHTWSPSALTYRGLLEDLMQREMEAPCDRLVGLIKGGLPSELAGWVAPRMLGRVERVTATRAVIVNVALIDDAVTQSGAIPVVEEFYRLLGCRRDSNRSACYKQIAAVKRAAVAQEDLLPGIADNGALLVSREEVRAALDAYFAEKRAGRGLLGEDWSGAEPIVAPPD